MQDTYLLRWDVKNRYVFDPWNLTTLYFFLLSYCTLDNSHKYTFQGGVCSR